MDLKLYVVGGVLSEGGLLEAISFVDACPCCHLMVARSNRFKVVFVNLRVAIPLIQ
jgi:hypothetical protein